MVQVPLENALRFASRNPAEFIGVGHMLGKLAPGYRADMVAIDPETITVLATWVAGSDQTQVLVADSTTSPGSGP